MKSDDESHDNLAVPEKNERLKRESKRGRILVVDDDSSVREMLSRVLTGEGYHVWMAGDGDLALQMVAAHPIDLVLLDLNLPGKGGWDTFERLTMDQAQIAVIIITARSNQLFTALGAGAGALLEKPLDFPQLLETVERLLAEPPESRMSGRNSAFYFNSTHPNPPR